MDMKERRCDKRYPTLNFVHYVFEGCGESCVEDMGRTLDASERGLLIETHIPLPIGQRLNLSVGFGDNIVELGGEVVHSVDDGNGMSNSGIEFDLLYADQSAKLNTFLQAFAKAKV
ncbi:MAG: PilZ domain-containing protein [Thermodesulfobacteriota bacterium]|nr:PilZ domain-containing protein [Thermodesulfobacteriota bacterium]